MTNLLDKYSTEDLQAELDARNQLKAEELKKELAAVGQQIGQLRGQEAELEARIKKLENKPITDREAQLLRFSVKTSSAAGR